MLDSGFTSAAASKDKTRRARLGTLLPAYVDASFPDNTAGEYTFGGLADSYYEYMVCRPLSPLSVFSADEPNFE